MLRRFLIWSGLAVLIGLALSVSGYLAYDLVFARYQPVTITRQQGEIQRLLDEASWLSPGQGDRIAYVVGYRNGPTEAYLRREAPRLRAAGVDVRVLIVARPEDEATPAERATIAELWLSRDWALFRRWLAAPADDWTAETLVPADGSLARTGVVEASRDFARSLSGLMRGVGIKPTWPLVVWRDREGFLKACACAHSRSWAAVRADFDAPETAPPEPPAPAPAPAVSPAPPAPTHQGLPYPDPAIAPRVARPAAPPSPTRPPAPAAAQPPVAPSARTDAPRPASPRTAPSQTQRPGAQPARPSRPSPPPRGAKIEPDSLFY